MTTRTKPGRAKTARTQANRTQANRTQGGPSARQKVEEQIADRIIELLDQGELPPWEKQWHDSMLGSPMNTISMKPYRGINHWLTLLTQDLMGYTDPRWLTFKQAQGLGGSVMKGEKGTQVIFWKPIQRQQGRDGQEGEEKERGFPVLRAYTIFNIAQTQGCELRELPEPPVNTSDPIERAEAIISGMPDPPEITQYEHDNQPPHYVPGQDIVRVPSMSRFKDPGFYYNTMFHELTHATGHPQRLGRFELGANARDLHAYGREELVAGMGAAMLGGHAGIGARVLELDASYIQNWRDTIGADKTIVVRAASLAQRAVDLIMGETNNPEPEAPGEPEQAAEHALV